MPEFTLRDAVSADTESLRRLEDLSFGGDRLSARSFRRLIRSPSAACRVVAVDGQIAGYALLLFRTGTTVARLYSIAVAAQMRGIGLASALLEDAAHIAARRDMTRLRLEVREDNTAAIRLYERLGFRRVGTRTAYYADQATALRYEKRLNRRPLRSSRRAAATAPIQDG